MVKKIYQTEWKKFKEDYRKIFIGMLITMITVGFISYWISIANPEKTTKLMNIVVQMISEKGFDDVMGEGDSASKDGVHIEMDTKHKMFYLIFKNNLIAVTMVSLAGIFSYFILPYFYGYLSIVINSLLIGIVLAYEQIQGGSAIKTFLFSIMPHGLTEFTALLFASTLCIFTGNHFFKSFYKVISSENKNQKVIAGGEETIQPSTTYWGQIKDTLKKTLMTYLTVIIPLVFISAVIESYATIHIMNWFM